MYRFDSRFLRQFDSVTRQFTEPGEYYFYMAIHPHLSASPNLNSMASVEVDKKEADKPTQHRVKVEYDSATHSFIAQPQKLTIRKGDTIQWHKPKEHSHGYFVKVIDKKGKPVFNSQELRNNAVFTHFFSHPGEYHYQNILNESSQRPSIHVYQVDPSKEDWQKLSTTPTLIKYKNGKFTPEAVKVPEGGTVIWFIEGEEPVAIQLTCYDLTPIDKSKIPRPPRGKKGCGPEQPPCNKKGY